MPPGAAFSDAQAGASALTATIASTRRASARPEPPVSPLIWAFADQPTETGAQEAAPALEDPDQAVPAVKRSPFSQGNWSLHPHASAAFSLDDGSIYLAHFGVGYCFLENHTVNLELALGGVDGDNGTNNSAASSVELIFRSRLLEKDDLDLYVDGGAGVFFTTEDFPVTGTDWNFTPQLGMGMLWRLTHRTHLSTGVRWYHVSNAGRRGDIRNPGSDSLMLYAGVLYTF